MASGPTEVNLHGTCGEILAGVTTYAVQRHGILFGSWTLNRDDQTIATSERPTAAINSFKIHRDGGYLTGKPPGTFSDGCDLLVSGAKVGQIVPAHAFTRRASMQCEDSVPEFIQLSAFWMAADVWFGNALTRHV